MKNFVFAIIIIVVLLVINSCSKSQPEVVSNNTFDSIQDQILTKSCATSGCHSSSSDATYPQHNLILTKGNSYNNLFKKTPINASAVQENMKLVVPFDSKNSLFYQKLLFSPTHNTDNLNFGSIMPLGNDMLFQGQIEYIRQWIEAGAPQVGNVASAELLNDKTKILTNFVALTPPIPIEGYQMKLDPFEIYPNFEREIFVRKPLGNTDSVYINKFTMKMYPGSHHFILYGFNNNTNLPAMNVLRDIRNQNNSINISTLAEMSNHIFYFGGSSSNFTFNFPEGTAVALPPNITFDMNSHYFNKSSKSYNGQVDINLYKVDKSKVKHVLTVMNLGNQSLVLPPKQVTTVSKTFTFNKPIKIVTLTSHTHKLGQKFEIIIKGGSRNGEVIYTSSNWEEPNKIDYANSITLNAGEGLTSRITYNNYTDQTVRFGLTSEDEMGIIFGYYYEF